MAVASGLWVFVAVMVGCRCSGLLGFVVVVEVGLWWWWFGGCCCCCCFFFLNQSCDVG